MTRAKFFIKGAISTRYISGMIGKHGENSGLGAHVIFLGQVRSDKKNKKVVKEIQYSVYAPMAEKEFQKIKDEAFERYPLHCLHIVHSTGKVGTGEISLAVMASAGHRKKTFEALKFIVEQIKKRVPIWKKEVYDDGSEVWIKH
ncbi:MAG: molybdenum cofactor biosynthesis protein MoaE [Bacteroidetes bacterium]|nr:molybdenum cofactor biosynthesis protein MoaE [Bacteroidota bacterium]